MKSHVLTMTALCSAGLLALTACANDTEEPDPDTTSAETADTDTTADSDQQDATEESDPDAAASNGQCHFASDDEPEPHDDQDTLRYWADQAGIYMGNVAAGGGHHVNQDYPDPFPDDAAYREHLALEYSSLTHENYLKWDAIHPDEWGQFDFEAADAVVEFAQEHGIQMRGHALFWHSQNPDWLEDAVEAGEYSADELRDMLEEHVRTVVSRYAGCIQQWDAVNEIYDDADQPQLRDGSREDSGNLWLRELGPEILDDVFEWAHEEDPDALLFYNDYNVDGMNPKAGAYYDLITEQLERGVPVHGFGAQTHLSMNYAFDNSYQENLQRFSDLGLSTAVTEIDVRGEVDDQDQMSQEDRAAAAQRYETVLEACLAVDGCDSFTVWGTLDEYSWVPGAFDGEGDATLHELDSDGEYERKATYCIIQRTLVDAASEDGTFDSDETFEQCQDVLSQYGLDV